MGTKQGRGVRGNNELELPQLLPPMHPALWLRGLRWPSQPSSSLNITRLMHQEGPRTVGTPGGGLGLEGAYVMAVKLRAARPGALGEGCGLPMD